MKKVFLTIVLAAVAATSAFAQLDFGVGYISNAQKLSYEGYSHKDSFSGFYVGADYQLAEFGAVKFTPGAYLSYFGRKEDGFKYSEMYLNIPANFSFGIDFSSDLRGFVYAGPTLSLGLTSNMSYEKESADMYKENSDYGRFDILVGGGVGVDIKQLVRVTLGYNAGLINRNKASSNVTLKDSGFHLGVAYIF